MEYSSPVFESSPANYYELILNSTEYSGYVADLNLLDFFSSVLDTTSQACAILGGVNTISTHVQSISGSSSFLNGNYKADQTPIESKNNIENIGTAVFFGDKLVGELNNVETLCHLAVINELENATISIPNPFASNSSISVYVFLSKPSSNKVTLVDGFPYIECNIYVSGNVLSMDRSVNLSSDYDLSVLNSYINTYLEDSIIEYLYKTSKELKSDIVGFGKYLLPNYSTWNQWENSDWLNNYQNAFFKVNVETNLQSGYLFNKT